MSTLGNGVRWSTTNSMRVKEWSKYRHSNNKLELKYTKMLVQAPMLSWGR